MELLMTPGEELRLYKRIEHTEKRMKLFRFLSIVQIIIIGGFICLN